MTSLNFDARYQLLKCVAVADGIRTHNALETVTGRVVMVHLVDDAGPEEVEGLQSKLGRLDQSDKVRILEVATVHAGFAVVTEFLQGLVNFSEWLDARAQPAPDPVESSDVTGRSVAALREQASEASSAAVPADSFAEPGARGDTGERMVTGSMATVAPPPPLSPAAMPAAQPLPPGEFTSMFGAQPSPAATAAPAPPTPAPPAPPAAPPVASTPAPELQPGEFTRLFQSAASGSAPRVETPPAPTPLPSQSPTPSPLASMGERLGAPDAARQAAPFNLPAAGATPARPVLPLAPASGASGAFSSFPSLPPLPTPAPAPPSAARTPPAQPPSPIGGSPFGLSPSPAARAPEATPPPPRAVSADPRPRNASPLGAEPPPAKPLGAHPVSSLPPLPPLPPVLPAPVFGNEARSGAGAPAGPARAEATPGVYTQLIQQSVTPAPVVSATVKPTTLPAERKRSIPLGLIVALNVVLLLAIALVLYFVLRPATPAAVPGDGVPAAGSLPSAKVPAAPSAPAIPKPAAPTIPKP